jgi:hypothetical protein
MIIVERVFRDNDLNGRLIHLTKGKEGRRLKQIELFKSSFVVEKRGEKYFVLKDRYDNRAGRVLTYEELIIEAL